MKKRAEAQQTFADMVMCQSAGPRTTALLDALAAAVPWKELVKPILRLPEYAKYIADPSHPGERPIDPQVMLRCLMLAKWFNLSDPQLEEQLQDRLSFRRFAGLSMSDRVPDETTFVKFRRRLREAGLDEVIFDTVVAHLKKQGLLVEEGSIVDARIIEQSTGHKTGRKDESGEDITTRDPEAGFTKKHGRTYFGYKMHTATDRSGVVTAVVVSSASDHDSRHMEELIVGEDKAVYADSAYSDRRRREELARRGVFAGICHKRVRGQAELEPWQRVFNRMVSRVRALGEHPYAWMTRLMNFCRCRYRGLRRNAFDFVMTVAAYNVRRAVSLLA